MRKIINYESIMELIIENDLTENDTILLHPKDYDTVATEYITEHDLMIFKPVEILGTKIIEDTYNEVKKNQVSVLPLVAS